MRSQLSPAPRPASRQLLISEQRDAVGRAGGLSPTRWTRAFDTELIPKGAATRIHLSFGALSWRGRRGLVSGTGDSRAKGPRAHLESRRQKALVARKKAAQRPRAGGSPGRISCALTSES